jgi:DNA-binding transcriptional LysR family regulator
MHEYLARKPFDLYALHLFELVVKHQSFTLAAREAGLSQSAITRQMQALESRLGVDLLQRTTRSVEITEAGRFLAAEAARLLGGVRHTLENLRVSFAGARLVVRVGLSRSVAVAHLPGFFHANQTHTSSVLYQSSAEVLRLLEEHELDVGVLCPPKQLSETFSIRHRFKDDFTLVMPSAMAASQPRTAAARAKWLKQQPWITFSPQTHTGAALGRWLKRHGLAKEPVMESDNFDLIINLVASGLGISLVPKRALALYRRREAITRVDLEPCFSRELVVITRRQRKLPAHVAAFIDEILF